MDIRELCEEKQRSVMIGFNRRFSPHALEIKKKMGSGKMSMIYRINAGAIPADSWIQDLQVGGGRIVGEACHFSDLITLICNNGIGVVCVAYLIYFQSTTMKDMNNTLNKISTNLTLINERLEKIEEKKGSK